LRETALSAEHVRHSPQWIVVHGMRIPGRFAAEGDPRDLALADLSCFVRTGLKGRNAARWLVQRGVQVPPRANTWTPHGSGGLVARLGETEFLIEDGLAPGSARDFALQLEDASDNVYPVLRQDTAIALTGNRVNEVLRQTCSVDFASIDTAGALVMTSMIGVPVLVIPQTHDGFPLVRIWTDPTFGPYLWRTLLQIVQELGGGPAGLSQFYPEHQHQGESA